MILPLLLIGRALLPLAILLRRIIITIYFWFWLCVSCILATIIMVPMYLLGVSQHHLRNVIEDTIAAIPFLMMHLVGFWELKITNNTRKYIPSGDRRDGNIAHPPKENNDDINGLSDNDNYVIVSNHLSIIDTLFTALLPFKKVYIWSSKWKNTPVFGWLCQLAGHISIDKTSEKSKNDALSLSHHYLKGGTSVLFYVEGMRGTDPTTLLPFKTGAFRVANLSNKKILPVTLLGTHNACNGFICDIATIRVIVDEPTYVTNIELSMEYVRQVMLINLATY